MAGLAGVVGRVRLFRVNCSVKKIMSDEQSQADQRMKLARLRLEHDDFHAAINAMIKQKCDPLQVQRMKKKKLELKDRIKKIASKIIPDMPA